MNATCNHPSAHVVDLRTDRPHLEEMPTREAIVWRCDTDDCEFTVPLTDPEFDEWVESTDGPAPIGVAISSVDLSDLARGVLAHAQEHYEEGGWDVLVECYTVYEMTAWLANPDRFDHTIPRPTNLDEALAIVQDAVSVWADRQADARNSAF